MPLRIDIRRIDPDIPIRAQELKARLKQGIGIVDVLDDMTQRNRIEEGRLT